MVTCTLETPRDKAMRLVREKDKIEQEIAEWNAVLNANNIGMREPLVDSEGFPRNDIDVARVRHARHRIICLQNDHKDKMKEIEVALDEFYAGGRADGAGPSNMNVHQPNANGHVPNGHIPNGHGSNGYLPNGHASNGVANGEAHQPPPRNEASIEQQVTPIALVVNVCEGSPADLAGLRSDDAIIQFGSLNSRNTEEPSLAPMEELVTHSIGRRIQVKVKRGNSVLNLVVVPRPWQSDDNRQSLLGANLRRITN
ncbi:26S proteasome non-ATPase regulatory subunit 9 [Galleria mellonella]|uniref:26S proteasome non-ATPase regulatory subunit 9 n=1 Tax=Galleria mellonella TaxID=7137 RepID=A0A6J1WIV7_GALME|nr:26S proteasome non-ATPase regulatory subunit 9 [Galleria mellonella]